MKCIRSCFPCLCGNRNSARITPSEPIQIVQANALKHHQRVNSGGGCENENDAVDNDGRINPNFNMGDEPSSSESDLSVKALFIEVGKDRLLRVIHIRSKDDDDDSQSGSCSKSNSPNSGESTEQCSPEKSPAETSENEQTAQGGDDEEDEYWFSKWARKPRFRSIFAKNPNTRPRISENNNNNSVGSSPEENNKVSAELEMARAQAAAKRRAWAYNNNGSCESITQQPTVNLNDEEEFSSIAIVNTTKQQWSKTNSPEKELGSKTESSPFSSSSVQQVEVAVEKHSPNYEGMINPAFQGDDDEDEEGGESPQLPPNETDEVCRDTVNGTKSKSSSISTASVKSRLSSNSEEEDAIISEPIIANEQSTSSSSSSKDKRSSPTATTSVPLEESTLPPKKPLLFFIHSISGSSDVWHHQMEFFQNLGYEIVVPDLLGHGLSSTPLNPKYYYFESLVQDLILIFDHFTREDMKVVLVGHGYGACLAAMLTRVRLKNVALLISIAGGGPTPLVRRTCCQDSWFSWKCKLFHSNRIRGRFDNPELKHILPPSIHENVLSGQVWQDGDSAFYRRVTVPTLLVYGMRDKVVTLVEECEMERTIPKSFLELIDSAGHMVMLNDPEKLNKMMCKFIQSWS
ncbi:Abhydrolase domain-containing protein 8 [Orchesella cincta]|uniref:acylglycerol lipase n=1 Tax=Orchesella cincta TaxID=48709 RepID=A0A1D2NH62_ORCCI|nr:Abhydrolase domain-containing protein 8 [Orchesella cincta]